MSHLERQLLGVGDRVVGGDLHDLVDQLGVQVTGDETSADTLSNYRDDHNIEKRGEDESERGAACGVQVTGDEASADTLKYIKSKN
jgi:hypothetical protein